MLDAQAQSFIDTIYTQAKIAGVTQHRPVSLIKNANDKAYVVIVSYDVPSYMGAPLGCIWVDPNPVSLTHGRIFKLAGVAGSTVPTEGVSVSIDSTQVWHELSEYAHIFTYTQVFYLTNLDLASNVPGPVGPKGDSGAQGPVGPIGTKGRVGSTGSDIIVQDEVVGFTVAKVLAMLYADQRRPSDDRFVFYGTGPHLPGIEDEHLYEFLVSLTKVLANVSVEGLEFTIDQQENQYGYLMVPKTLVQGLPLDNLFVDVASGFSGGWDGLVQGTNKYRSIYHQYSFDSSVEEFLVYRTDYPSLGKLRWKVLSTNI